MNEEVFKGKNRGTGRLDYVPRQENGKAGSGQREAMTQRPRGTAEKEIQTDRITHQRQTNITHKTA